jgi:transglutaminase-like putative cysteine protease
MSTRRRALADSVALTAAAAGTSWLATTSWRGFTEAPGRFLWPLLLVALLVAGIGAGLRHLRWPPTLVLVVQLVVGLVVAASLAGGALVLTRDGWLSFGSAISDALNTAERYQAPVPAEAPGIESLLILGGFLCMVVVDFCVGGLRRVSLAGLPLLTIYSIPISMISGGVAWWSFALTAGGFLLLLFLQHREQTTRWGRGIGEDGATTGSPVSLSTTAVRTSAGALAGSALVLAVLVPQFVPTLSLSVFGFGPGSGSGGDITVENPMTDLRRDLLRGEDEPVLRFETEDSSPSYLRLAALTAFNDNEWSTGERDIPDDQRAQGPVPTDEIDPAVDRLRYEYSATASIGFESDFLVLAFPVDRVSALGDWRYDTDTLDFMAVPDGLSLAGLSYEFSELELDIRPELLRDAPSWSGKVSRDYIELPDDFPPFVRNLAQDVTRDFPTRYEKAVALQDWFREDGGFTYDTENVEVGNGVDELVAFLTEGEGGRVGYCEQFASAMAAMARSLGIPARVAVGFLNPTRQDDGSWVYSTHDFHAWPELYFAGAGWVRFEPTPSDRAANVPSYAQGTGVFNPPEETNGPTEQPSATNPLGPGQTLDPGNLPEGQSDQAGGGRGIWDDLLVVLAILVLLALVALAPRLIRRAGARRRLYGAVEPAWAELRATTIDLGLPWPEARSPHETRDQLVRYLGTPGSGDGLERPARGETVAPEAVESLDRLVLTLELLRYARPDGVPADSVDAVGDGPIDPQVVDDTRTVQAALYAGATRRAQRRATWWPASVLPWRSRVGELAAPSSAERSGVVDHVG